MSITIALLLLIAALVGYFAGAASDSWRRAKYRGNLLVCRKCGTTVAELKRERAGLDVGGREG